MDAANQALLERAKRARSVSRSLVTKQINKLENEINNSADKTTVYEIYVQLISKYEELSTLDKEVESLINIESLEDEILTREEYRDKFIIWKIRAERYIGTVSSITFQNSVENQPQNDISSFPSFWARFKSAVDDNSNLNDVDKFSYLKSVVTSDAELAIRGLTLTPENYAKAVKILEDRFGRKELIVDYHMNRLLNLSPVRKSFDVIALRKLYDQLEINIRGLESLEIFPDSYSCLLFPIIMKAIPPDLALEYNKKHNEKQSQVTDLTTYLRGEVESRERTEILLKPHGSHSYPNKYSERAPPIYPQPNRKGQGHSRFYPSHKSGVRASANELLSAAVSNCLFCSEDTHASDMCENLCVQEKRAKLINEEESISAELRRFWEIESLGIRDNDSVSLGNGDEEILSEFDKSVCFVDGRYRVSLPWKPGMREVLQNNKTVARKRFEGLVRRFKCDHELFCEYKDVIDNYVREGIVERTSCDSLSDSQGFYLPHHAVIRSDKTTSRLHIVFDGSAHEDGHSSLNQSLYTGPNLHPNMLELLLRFRKNPVAFTADVKSAFLQIELDLRDREFTRFFWTDNLNNNPYVLNFTRVLFGLRPSPYLLAATLKHHFKKYKEQYPHTFDLLNSSIYVDDFICGRNDVPDALRTTLECLQIFSDASMLLRKWRTNSKQLDLLWQQEGVETEFSETSATDLKPPIKVLGLAWDSEKDLIYFDPKDLLKFMSRKTESKRFILSVVGRIFDPIGILGPFVIKLKCLLQDLWTLGVDWDSELPPKLRHKWQQWSSKAEGLTEIKIPRFYLGDVDQELSSIDIHCFSDASKSAYGTILYLRFVTCNNKIETSFICSKSRVAPLKSLTLPRLELTAALLSARLAKQVSSCLKFNANIYYWTDSLISYYWIRGDSSAFKPYIKNRVQEIQLLSDPSQWGHCPGKDNPADLISRGTSAVKLAQNELWWHGPPWLKPAPDHWPNRQRDILDSELCSEELEYRSSVHVAVTQQRESLVDINRFSSLKKLLKVTAWVFRFVNNARIVNKSMNFYITADEIQNAEYFWLKYVQYEFYSAEILTLKRNEQLRCSSEIKSLVPYLGEDNLLKELLDGCLKQTYALAKSILLSFPDTVNLQNYLLLGNMNELVIVAYLQL
ncbi:integrase catalytic domain-containing protein [Trichonephila clavata]|uniref:Integrase catalytic domain-containing protein n=1 Tax=Trichonephila clavata TaxID=2740835 RepID=A0A8X6KF71_TRICU|nr:integrase catalytic domain-containing protein [Trichonephila clavata]